MKKSLIALVATAVMVEGVRTVIQPGEKLPPLPAHDEKELVASGSASDGEAEAKALEERQAAEKKGAEEFAAARAEVLAQADSIKTEGDTVAPTAAKPAAKTAKKS